MDKDLVLDCERVTDVDVWGMDELKVSLDKVNLNKLVADYGESLLAEFDIEDLIAKVKGAGYTVEENKFE